MTKEEIIEQVMIIIDDLASNISYMEHSRAMVNHETAVAQEAVKQYIEEISNGFEKINKIRTRLLEVDIPLEKFEEIDLMIQEEMEK